MKTFEPHKFACIFPMMPDEAINDLANDIRANGLEKPGVLYEGKILDGRNRYKACQVAGVQMQWEEIDLCDDSTKFDALSYVLSLNLHRRHLSQSQRAQCAAEVAKLREGRPSNDTPQNCGVSASEAAKTFGVSTRSVETAKHVADKGAKQVVEAVKDGSIPVSLAAKLVDAVPDKAEQKKLVQQGAEAVREATKQAKPSAAKATDGDCIRGGDHEWEKDDDGQFCKKCQEPREAKKDGKESFAISKFKKLWSVLDKTEQKTLLAWIASELM